MRKRAVCASMAVSCVPRPLRADRLHLLPCAMSLLETTPPRRRHAPWWTSTVDRERQRLIPPWMAVGLGLLVAGGLTLTFPYQNLETRIARQSQVADPLQMEYIRLWLRVRPEAHDLRFLLAQQLVLTGDYAGAHTELHRLIRHAGPQLAERAVIFEIDASLREAYAFRPDDPRRKRILMQLQERLHALAQEDLPPLVHFALAGRAVEIGAANPAARLYAQVLARDLALPASAWEDAAQRMSALGELDLTVRLYLRAQSLATQRADKRRLFITALRTLVGAGRHHDALVRAEESLGDLADDIETLEFLTRLALAANRPDVAQHYARRMLHMSLYPADVAAA